MIYRDYISWWLRPMFLQPWGHKSDTLFAGPWLGEFGWELMNWQPFLRKLAASYNQVIVACRPGSEALYRDFATRFVMHNVRCTSECDTGRDIRNPDELERILAQIPEGADHIFHVGWRPDKEKTFLPFGRPGVTDTYDVVFHPRGRSFGGGRNWGQERWEQLIAELVAEGRRLACIGVRGATLDPQGAYDDLRDIPLDQTMDLMASARLVLGPSSGPMHLASLCRAPHLVWTDRQHYARGLTSREKYERWWNPFGTPVHVIDSAGFDPSVQVVHDAVSSLLDSSV